MMAVGGSGSQAKKLGFGNAVALPPPAGKATSSRATTSSSGGAATAAGKKGADTASTSKAVRSTKLHHCCTHATHACMRGCDSNCACMGTMLCVCVCVCVCVLWGGHVDCTFVWRGCAQSQGGGSSCSQGCKAGRRTIQGMKDSYRLADAPRMPCHSMSA